MNRAWSTLCPPAQIFPVVMSGVVLFNLYRGTYRYAVQHTIAAVIGTIFLWILCAAKMEFAAYGLLILPVLFFVFLLAIVYYDQTLLTITSTYGNKSSGNANGCDVTPECDSCNGCV